jgi:predicted HicB family RNase H-like nuclease
MNTLTHKGFIGIFNYIEDEDILHGKIEGITDLVTFQGIGVPEIKKAFIDAVEDYIELCAEVGKEPLKSFKGSFNVRVSPTLHRLVSTEAIKRNMNLNQFVQKALEQAIHANA